MLTPTTVTKYSLLADRPLAELTAYIAAPSPEMPFNAKRKAVLIIPGGAYWMNSDTEADPVAHYYLSMGFNAFTLRYSTGRGVDSVWPKPLLEASAAMKFIRDHAEEFHIDPDYVFAAGFSAGGHLCAALGSLWDNDEIEAALGMEKGYNRPTGTVLSYPVINPLHRGSFLNLFNQNEEELTEEVIHLLSLENQVSADTPPTFLWHNADDRTVPAESSLVFALALTRNGIPFEMRIWEEGGHGCCLGTYVTKEHHAIEAPLDCHVWVGESVRFLLRH